MEIRRIVSPFFLAVLFGLFAFTLVMVWLTRGKKAGWIARKMKLGAAILALTGVSTGCPPVITCYEPMPMNWFEFDQMNYDTNAIVIDLPSDSLITGTLRNSTFPSFSFEIVKNDSLTVQKGEVLPRDGEFNAETEKFNLPIHSALEEGLYHIYVFGKELSEEESESVVAQNRLIVK